MIEYKRLRIDITDIRKNGVVCANPVITWVTQQGVIYPCIGEDYIEVEVLPNQGGYVEFFVQCSDCEDCPPLHVKRGLCDTSADCEDCETCTEGWCVPICPDQLCVNDTCVDCADSDDCPDGKICLNGKCVCPVDKPFIDPVTGECASCIDDGNCGPCAICVNGECVAVDCGDGACNPATGECVECMKSGDCTGPNECCVGNKCECCSGYEWDYDLKQCVPADECKVDTDCAECEICVNGECVPLECPAGYICVDGECTRICDCYGGGCPQGSTCVPYGEVCICVPCEGDCLTNSDCEDGCYCGEGGTCIPSPCNGSCDNAADCGEGCGCLDGECVPCDSINCATDATSCAEITGCECDGKNCEKTDKGDCTGGCVNFLDCGEGCTCYEGECVPCAWFDCTDTSCSDQDGCGCYDGDCENNPGDRDCSDEFTITKIDETCDLQVELSGTDPCSCANLSLGSKVGTYTVAAGEYSSGSFKIEVRKGSSTNINQFHLLPLLTDNSNPAVADNEEPTSGSVEIGVVTTYYVVEQASSGSGYVRTGETVTGSEATNSASMANKSAVEITGVQLPNIGYIDEGNLREVKSVKITSRQKTNLVFPNGCTYDAVVKIGDFTYDSYTYFYPSLSFARVKTISSDDTRYPLFTIYKSQDNTFDNADIFRKVYVAPSAGKYTDTLLGMAEIPADGIISGEEGELWGNRYYKAVNDCACEKEADLGKLVFCNPTQLNYTLSTCNTQITLNAPFEPCTVNQDITQWETSGYDIPNDVQTKYILYLNGLEVATFVHEDGSGVVNEMVIEGTSTPMLNNTFTFDEPITSIMLRINYDDANECTLNYTVPPIADREVEYGISDCLSSDTKVVIAIPKSNNGYTVDEVSSSGGVTDDATNFYVEIDKNVLTSITVIYDDGCQKAISVKEDCCSALTATLSSNDVSCGGNLTLSTTVAGGNSPYTYKYLVPASRSGSSILYNAYTSETVGPLSSSEYINGIAKVTVTDANGCSKESSLTINSQSYDFTAPNTISACDGVAFDLVLQGTAGAEVATNIPGYGTVTLPQTISLTETADTQYIYSSITVNPGTAYECTFSLGNTTVVDVEAEPTAVITDPSSGAGQCSIDPPIAEINGGTSGATVYYTINGVPGTPVVLDTHGNGVISLPTTEGTKTVTRTKVELDGCQNLTTQTVNIGVNVEPTLEILAATYACDDVLATYSVEFTSTTAVLSSSEGGSISNIGTDLWQLSGVTKGVATTITATNGVCEKQATTTAVACGCEWITVDAPTSNGDQSYCDGDSVPDLTVNSALTVRWYNVPNGGSILKTGLTFNAASDAGGTYEPSSGEAPVFYAEAYDAVTDCTSARIPLILTNYAVPTISLYTSDTQCEYTDYTVNSNVTGYGTLTYLWTTDVGTIKGGIDDEATVNLTLPAVGGSGTLTLTVTDSHGCETSETHAISVGSCCVTPRGVSATLITEGCYTDSDGSPLEIDVDFDTGYIDPAWDGGVKIKYELNGTPLSLSYSYPLAVSCSNQTPHIVHSSLILQDMTAILTAANNNLTAKVYKVEGGVETEIYDAGTILVNFAANNCP